MPAGSPFAGLPLPTLEAEAQLIVHGVFRNGAHVFVRKADVIVAADDLLVIEGDLDGIDTLIGTGGLTAGETSGSRSDEVRIEAVVMPQSTVIGSALSMLSAFRKHGVEIIAFSPQRRRLEGRLGGMALSAGDVLVVAGRSALSLVGGGPWLLVAGTLLIAIVVTPFLNNVSTAIILAPIAASVAVQAGLPPEPFLMAVAIGASTDFLTPFGYHNNSIVMGTGGYHFIDYPRVGAPLTVIVLVLAPPLLIAFWL